MCGPGDHAFVEVIGQQQVFTVYIWSVMFLCIGYDTNGAQKI